MDHKNILLFYFEKGSRKGPNSEILHIWKAYLTLEIVKQDKCPKYLRSSILLCRTHYCVKQNPVSTLVQLPLSSCCGRIMLCSAQPFIIIFRLDIQWRRNYPSSHLAQLPRNFYFQIRCAATRGKNIPLLALCSTLTKMYLVIFIFRIDVHS